MRSLEQYRDSMHRRMLKRVKEQYMTDALDLARRLRELKQDYLNHLPLARERTMDEAAAELERLHAALLELQPACKSCGQYGWHLNGCPEATNPPGDVSGRRASG